MPQKPQKFCVSKPTVYRIDKREHNIGKRIAATCLIEIAYNLITSAAKQVSISPSTFFKICKRNVKHAKENDFPITDLSNYKNNSRLGKSTTLSLDKRD